MPRTEGGNFLEGLPQSLLHEILLKLDVQSLCSAASVSRTFHCSSLQVLASVSVLDLSGFSLDAQILDSLLCHNIGTTSLILNCRRLNDASIEAFTKQSLEELVLLKCSTLTSRVFVEIGDNCPNLRALKLEMVHHLVHERSRIFEERFMQMLKGCFHLEDLSVKLQEIDGYWINFGALAEVLPDTMKVLQLRPVYEKHAKLFIHHPASSKLRSLSLVLDIITDELIYSITSNLLLLVKLDLEDKPKYDPQSRGDLSNHGLQSLGACRHLTDLSLVRRREYIPTTFKMVNDFGMFLLVEGCKNLKSVKLGGFSRVTDAGFSSILHSCKRLQKFEVINAFFLSDLAFHDIGDASCSLVDVRLPSCSLLTSGVVESLSLCRSLETLDLGGCRSVADQGLRSISSLTRLSILNLAGADVTDSGLLVLGQGKAPIQSLTLRNCKRVTDRGLSFLLLGGGSIGETLLALDLGFMPCISDKTISTIIQSNIRLTDLCIRNCFHISDASILALGSDNQSGLGKRLLRRLDLCNCSGLTVDAFRSHDKPFFYGLRWLGVGHTRLSKKDIAISRTCLTICFSGCEIGCHDECLDYDEQ